MSSRVYHQVASEDVEEILQYGLERDSDGEKTDTLISLTDSVLGIDQPAYLRDAGVDRRNCTFAYLPVGNNVIDIKDGSLMSLRDFIAQPGKTVLELIVDSSRCYLSDLDAYDAVKNALKQNAQSHDIKLLAEKYWDTVLPLDQLEGVDFKRVEVIITYDIPAEDIRVASLEK